MIAKYDLLVEGITETVKQSWQKSSSESNEDFLSVKCDISGLYVLIGQCCHGAIGCETKVVQDSLIITKNSPSHF